MQSRNSFSPSSKKPLLALDAMGVIYAEADDGLNLLYPFIVEKGGTADIQKIVRLYQDASIGSISSHEFWRSVGIDPALEDEYLERHCLTEGLTEFLAAMKSQGIRLWCLSNDVSEWSRKLRKKFELEKYFVDFVISGDAGACKPNSAIYLQLLEKSGSAPSEVIFVDDRLRNIEAAHSLGIRGILFNPAMADSQGHSYPIVRTFSGLRTVLDCQRID
jgi:HAD superfamily hydrolase (TIGR01549 family)